MGHWWNRSGHWLKDYYYLKDPVACRRPSNMSPRENAASKVCVQLARGRGVTAQFPCGGPSWGWWLWHVLASNPYGGRKPPRHQHYHSLWVWGRSSKISKQPKASAELLETDASTKPTELGNTLLLQAFFFLGGGGGGGVKNQNLSISKYITL